MSQDVALMRQAVQLAHANRLRGGRPFGAVLTRGSEVLATGIRMRIGEQPVVQTHLGGHAGA